MKKLILTLLCGLIMLPVTAQNGESESKLNDEYRSAILKYLKDDIANREKTMQRSAEQMLISLPNEQKLYDETYLKVNTQIVQDTKEDGTTELNYVYDLSYNCRHLEGYTDDYPLAIYNYDSSNSVRAICNLTKTFVEGVLDDIFRAGKQVTIKIYSTTDGTELLGPLGYKGEYGNFRYCPTVFNGEQIRVSVDRNTGIQNNCQLAYIRAQSVRHFLETQVRNLQNTDNKFEYITRSYVDTGAQYRRSSIELTVHDAFRETIDLMTADKIQDDYVDFNIPQATSSYENAYVLIIANEDYTNKFLPSVSFAKNDGEMAKRYFVRALGVPERQVKLLNNASKADIMNDGINWLSDIAKAVATTKGDMVEPQANFFIYYAGLGYCDFENKAYIIPNSINVDEIKSLNPNAKSGYLGLGGKKKFVDNGAPQSYDIVLSGKESDKFTGQLISIDQICGSFKNDPVKNLTVIIDASFDGHQRNGELMIRPDKAIEKKTKARRRKINMRADAVVMLAADYDKTAYAFDTQHHGFLTYFLLKEIKGMASQIDSYNYQDIYEAVERKLDKESALQGRWQQIGGIAGGKYKETWQNQKIK